MNKQEVELFPHLPLEVVEGISGFKLCSYLVALEGWRRGLELKWYRDESQLCKLDRLNSSTQGKFFSLSSDKTTHYFFRSRGDKVLNKTVRVCQDKEATKDYLKKSGVPVPLGAVLNNEEEMIKFAEEAGYPVVVKPLKGSMGKGVYTNINSPEELKEVLAELKVSHSRSQLMIEKHYNGKEYRVYTVGDKVVGATNRIPANVNGDGVSNIQELINIKNNERESNPYLAPKPIKIDYEVRSMLKKLNYDENSIPKKNEKVFLREISNLSSGGDPIEATEELTPEIQQIAVDSLKALPSIPHAGVDIIVDPEDNKKGVVLEINATAEIGFHLYPIKGKAKDVPSAIIDYYFPETINNNKTSAYFDYFSTIEPLKHWSADELKVIKTPKNKMYTKTFLVSGKVIRVGYMNFIKRQAMRRGLSGYSRRAGKDIEVVIIGESIDELNEFFDVCSKGSRKSVVENVKESTPLLIEIPYKLGYEIR